MKMAKHWAGRILLFNVMTSMVACQPPPPAYLEERKAERALALLQLRLDESVEAEEAAVIATTDEDSQNFAAASRKAAAEVDQLRQEVHETLATLGNQVTLKKLTQFDTAWAKVGELDGRILPLAIANSNRKATELSQDKGVPAVNQLVDALTQIASTTKDVTRLRALSAASVAALRIQTLHAPHIAAADDATMTDLERDIETQRSQVNALFDATPEHLTAADQKTLTEATDAWADYQQVTADVVRLSRLNTNVISFQLSTHQKRAATIECETALSALVAELQSIQSKPPTR
jgi:hypothetical protein